MMKRCETSIEDLYGRALPASACDDEGAYKENLIRRERTRGIIAEVGAKSRERHI